MVKKGIRYNAFPVYEKKVRSYLKSGSLTERIIEMDIEKIYRSFRHILNTNGMKAVEQYLKEIALITGSEFSDFFDCFFG